MTKPAILEALARAIHCHDGRLPTPWDADMIARWPDDCEYERKVAMSQAAAVLELVGPRELVWEMLDEDGNWWRSPAPLFGSIRVENYGSGFTVNWSAPGITDTLVCGNWPDAKAAQAAAQSHADAAHWANTKIGGK